MVRDSGLQVSGLGLRVFGGTRLIIMADLKVSLDLFPSALEFGIDTDTWRVRETF